MQVKCWSGIKLYCKNWLLNVCIQTCTIQKLAFFINKFAQRRGGSFPRDDFISIQKFGIDVGCRTCFQSFVNLFSKFLKLTALSREELSLSEHEIRMLGTFHIFSFECLQSFESL